MAKVTFYAATDTVTTDINGIGQIKTKVPGTFTGIDGFQSPIPANGRYIKRIQIWSEGGVIGDMVTNIRVEDVDGVLPAPAISQFPEYPIIQHLSEQEIVGGSSAIQGLSIPINQMVTIDPIDVSADRGFQFVPSGLYICADFKSGDSAAGKVIRINYFWGRYL